MTLRASWYGSGRSCTGGWCGAGARSDRGVATAPRAEPVDCSREQTERSSWCIPIPLVGREGTGRSHDRSFPPVGRQRPLLEPKGSRRLPTLGGRRAREHRVEALLQQRYSGWPGQIMGHRSPRSRCHARPDECDLGRHPLGHAQWAQRAASIVPAQAAANFYRRCRNSSMCACADMRASACGSEGV